MESNDPSGLASDTPTLAGDTPTLAADTPTVLGETQPSGEQDTRPERAAAGERTRGESIGRYVVLERLGAGGMGVVYAAYDPELDRKVALKLVRAGPGSGSGGSGETARARLLREAQAMARISHTNVVAVFDVGSVDEDVFVAMEFIDGETLKRRMAGRPPWQELLPVFIQAGRGLAAAHAAGLVHRDFKPDNVMIDREGRVRVLDFGLARGRVAEGGSAALAGHLEASHSVSLDRSLTVDGAILGTPAYMAPEQHLGVDAGPPADQFGFCVALFEALYGERPFVADNLAALAFAVTSEEPRAVADDRGVPLHIRRAVIRGLSRNPKQRFPDMSSLLAELEHDPAARRRLLLGWGGGIVLVGALGVGAYAMGDRTPDPCAPEVARERMAGVWDADTRQRARDIFEAGGHGEGSKLWTSFDGSLSTYADAWAHMRTDACAATWVRKEQSAELMDLRMACLDRRHDELAAFVELVEQAPRDRLGELTGAAEAATALARLEPCADAEALRARTPPPPDEAARAELADLEHALAGVDALRNMGQFLPAREQLEDLEPRALELGHAPLEAEVLHVLGVTQDATGESKVAVPTLERSFRSALAAGDERLALRAAVELAYAAGYSLSEEERGRWWVETARALLRRRPDPELEASLDRSLGALLVSAGRYDEGAEAHGRALAALERLHGPESLDVASALNNIGGARFQQGKYDEALPFHERALSIYRAHYGDDHPDVAVTLSHLGNVLSGKGDLKGALVRFEEAASIGTRTVGRVSRAVAVALDNQARMTRKLDDVSKAIEIHERALEIWIELLGENHPDVAISLLNIGYAHTAAEDHESALNAFSRALSALENSVGKDHPHVIYACNGVGAANVKLERWRDAYPCLERVLVMDASQIDPTLTAETRNILAHARAGAGDRRGARILMQEALAQYREHGAEQWAEDIAEIEAWLREN